ncbi:MAG: phytanoyl-CoA dioxygenase family protein [Armatimonadota bacterium]|nr:phytanoyl-CoA dioxygenase family protein [Armatimonadota bacterium]
MLGHLSSTALQRSRAGVRHLLSVLSIADFACDPRLFQIAQGELGQDAVPFRATLFDKSAAANWLVPWHQDTALPLRERLEAPDWGPWSQKAGIAYAHAPAWALSRVVALRVHLDASTSENGPLCVVPGSHLLGVLEDDAVPVVVRERGFTECLVPRGGVLAMRPLLIHASSKARTQAPRRVLHIEYADSLQLAPGIELVAA